MIRVPCCIPGMKEQKPPWAIVMQLERFKGWTQYGVFKGDDQYLINQLCTKQEKPHGVDNWVPCRFIVE